LLHFIPFFWAVHKNHKKVVAVVDPCAAKFGDGLTLVMVLHWQNNRKNIAHKSQEQIEGSTEA